MKAANPTGKGHRVALKSALALVVILLMGAMFVLAGCGDETTTDGSTQPENSTGSGQSDDIKNVDSAGGVNLAGDDEVLAGYTWSDCVVEMTGRYGDESTAVSVCENLYTQHGDSDVSQLETVLAQVEGDIGVTPGNTSGGTGGTTGNTGGGNGSTGGAGGSGGSGNGGGWSTEIIVPPAP